jgi:23S rRNA (uracil1939-C5)-methyltransferase
VNAPNETICLHFGECGGCAAQDVPYATQVAAKAEALQELLGFAWPGPVPVTPSPVQWHYRNKVDPGFSPQQYETAPPKGFVRDTVLGYKRRGRWYWPLEVAECRIAPEGLGALLESVRAWYKLQGLRAYDSRTDEGFLRTLLVREGKHTGQRMVVLITSPGALDTAGFVEAVQRVFPAHSIQWGTFSGKADVAAADEVHLLHGAPAITEELHIPTAEGTRRLTFSISPFSFFQTNTLATERLYGALRAWVAECSPTVLYDLYGGAGGIAFSCSDLVEQVWSVESVLSASEDGRANAVANGISNVTFITQPVEHHLRGVLEGEGMPAGSAVIVDPARSGMHPKALKRLTELRPRNLAYVSCNPKVFARELPPLLEAYELTGLQGFDLFPHTPHVELVATFRARV